LAKRRSVSAFIQELPAEPESELPISAIAPSRFQPRRYFDPAKQQQLEASVKEHGVLEPLVVRPLKPGQYELVAGERRYRAAKAAGLASVPVTVRQLSDEQAMTLALVENLIREDLNPVEEVEGILALLGIELGIQVADIPPLLYRLRRGGDNVITELEAVRSVFDAVGMNWESFLANRLPLIRLPDDILDALRAGQIQYTKAKAIAAVKEEKERRELLEEAIARQLSLSQIRGRINELRGKAEAETAGDPQKRVAAIAKKAKKAKVWNDPKKRRKLEQLLGQLEALLDGEGK